MKPRNLLFIFLGILTVLRLIYIAHVELAGDEAYYYMWSQRLDWSYYSKGPGVAFAIRLGTALFGANEFGVRCLSPLLSLGTSLILYFFARRLYNESVAIWTVVVTNCIPIFNVGSLVMTIDPLSIFFWAAALFTFWLALESSPGFSIHWLLTGLFIGCGFLAKYTNAMQLLSILLVLLLTRRYRGEFARPGFWLMLIVFAACTLPVIIWNHDHAWITLTHLRSRGNIDSEFSHNPLDFIQQPLTFLAAQFGVYSPLIFGGLLTALWWTYRQPSAKFKPRFLSLFALPILIMYAILSIKKAGQPNWTALAFVSLGVLATALWHEAAEHQRSHRRFAIWAVAVGVLVSFLFISTDILRSAGIPLPYSGWDPSSRLRGWKSMAITVDDYRKKFEAQTGKPAFLIGKNYQTAASIAFYLPEKRVEGPNHPAVYIPESQDIESEFAFWPRYDEFQDAPKGMHQVGEDFTVEEGVCPFTGRNALYVTDAIDDLPPSTIQRGFQRVELVTLFKVSRHGEPLRQFRIFACYNYKSIDL